VHAARDAAEGSPASASRFFATLAEQLRLVSAQVRARVRIICMAEARLVARILGSAR
jgi:hypothetical protein